MSSTISRIQQRYADIVTTRVLFHPKLFRDEAGLMMAKWPDYRFLSPVEATLVLAKHYNNALHRYVRAEFDIDFLDRITLVRLAAPSAPDKRFSSLWTARRWMDERGLPYDVVVDFTFQFAARRKRRFTPQPNQLLPSEKNGEAWWALFENWLEGCMPTYEGRMGNLVQYRAENYRGLPPQDAFRASVLEVMQRSAKPWSTRIAERVFTKRHLDLEDILPLLPADERDEIVQSARSKFDDDLLPGPPRVTAETAEMFPSCFGIAEAIDHSTICGQCYLLSLCTDVAHRACAETERRTGSASPIQVRDRERSRRDTARSRSKAKSAAAAASTAGDMA